MAETEKPNWVKTKPAELEKIVIDLAKEGKTYAQIGLALRDQHGIPKSKLIGKRISAIIRDAKINVKTEKEIVKEKIQNLNTHLEKNKQDKKAKRSLIKHGWAAHKLDIASQ